MNILLMLLMISNTIFTYYYYDKMKSLITSEIFQINMQFYTNQIIKKPINVNTKVQRIQNKELFFLFTSTSWFEGYDVHHCLSDSRFNTTNVKITTNIRDLNKSDIVIFHPNEFDFRNLPKYRPEGQLWVWLNLEPPQNVKYLNISDDKFNYTATYRSDSDIFLPYGNFITKSDSFIFQKRFFKPFNERNKKICWLVSNWNSNFRNRYYEEMKKYMDIKVFGGFTKDPRRYQKCQIISDCKFYMSFENANHTDYITEKLWYNAYQCGAIPIVLGTSRKNYENLGIPGDSFIHVNDFENAKELADFIDKVAEDKNIYKKYFNWRKGRDIYFDDAFGTYFCRIVDYIKKYHPEPRTNVKIKDWFLQGWQKE